MSVFMDLNLIYTGDRTGLRTLLETAAHLGFSTVAINYVFEPTSKKKQEIPTPTPINELIDHLPVVQGRSRPIRVLNRLTVVMSDSSHFRPNATEYRSFDLLAVQPTTEKLFHAACMLYDVDIICISVSEKLPFFFKRAPVNGAADRGVVFEVSYSAAIRDSTLRRYTIANAINLMESCKGRNVILSSAAEKALELRGPYDVTNLYPTSGASDTDVWTFMFTQLWCSVTIYFCVFLTRLLSGLLFGLSDGDAKEAVCSTCRSVLLHAETRKTASGIIYTMRSCSDSAGQEGAPGDPEHGDPPAAKRHKLVLTQ
ncbi:ribonuclease P protein subunit p30 isoform X1 [Echeneis naucrates]|uniref:ribonuclease P protein subunit p30 isoform X1 n=1 Tax=Echeneis naucrates TaxID=173247 RepID=UPI0011145588|nr:ribonuclease P protein subunit p30 isoform X1 [Echeneis naucrates]